MTYVADGFRSFTPEHVGLIGICILGCVALVVVGRRRGDDPGFRRAFAIAIPFFTIPLQVLQLLPGDFRNRRAGSSCEANSAHRADFDTMAA